MTRLSRNIRVHLDVLNPFVHYGIPFFHRYWLSPYSRGISLLVYLGYSPFRAIRRILKMAFDRLGYIGLGDCPAGLDSPP